MPISVNLQICHNIFNCLGQQTWQLSNLREHPLKTVTESNLNALDRFATNEEDIFSKRLILSTLAARVFFFVEDICCHTFVTRGTLSLDIWYQIPFVARVHLLPNISYQRIFVSTFVTPASLLPDSCCQRTLVARHHFLEIYCQTLVARHQFPDISCQTFVARHQFPDICCQTFIVSELLLPDRSKPASLLLTLPLAPRRQWQ